MPDKAELRRRRAQSQRDKAKNRQEKEEAKRRRAQSLRDKARNQLEEERTNRIARAVQRQRALDFQLSQPAAVPEAQSSTISIVAIMEARSAKLMRDIARF
jgi:hypothetical protein